MKNILSIIFLFFAYSATAQEVDSTLYQKTKVELAKVYVTEVQRVCGITPLLTFNDSVPANVPTTKYTTKKFKVVGSKLSKYQEAMMQEYLEIIPYSDKKEIIETILYLRTIK